MRGARVWSLLLLASIGTGIFWTVSSRTPRIDPARAQPSAAPRDDALPTPANATTPSVERTPQETASAVPPPPSEGSDDPWRRWLRDPETGILVEGTVTVIDAEEHEHSEEDGEFVPMALLHGNGGGSKKVLVHAGRFRLHLPRGYELGIGSLVLGGRPAFLPEDPSRPPSGSVGNGSGREFTIVEGQPLQITARWERSFRLHVVDASDQRDLDDVSVSLARSAWWSKDFMHPGALDAAEKLVESKPSPIELIGPRSGSNLQWCDMVWVHAPGRTWGCARVDFQKGGEATIELTTGADLEVTLVGTIPPAPPTQKLSYDEDTSRAVLRLRPRDFATLALEAPPAKSGVTRFEGLRAGSFDLALERGKFFDRPLVLGATQVELVAGSTAHATITIVPPQEPRRVRVGGTLHLSPEWKCTWLDLRFEPIDVPGGTSLEARGLALTDLTPVDESPGLYRFELTPILPGRYLVRSYTYAYQQLIETGDAGRDDVAISIGDPADVVVHVLDADSALPVHEPNLLLWNCRWPGDFGGGLESTTWDESLQAWRFRAPSGEIELRIAFDSRRWELCEPNPFVTVHTGSNEFTIHVRRASGFFVRFELAGKRVEWPRDARSLRLEPPSGEPFTMDVRMVQDDEVFVPTATPGRWRVVVPALRGYLPIEPVEVVAEEGQVQRVGITLTPAR